MISEFRYTVDPNVEEPILLLNKHIGYDAVDGMGIDGSMFQQELLQLDGMGKKRIQVWINSPGGLVSDGYNIFNAILKSNTPVDTYNVGIAASIAGVIFMAGRKRIMADYASLMIHSPSGSEDKKAMGVIGDSLANMLAAKSSIDATAVKFLMERTSWLNAAECFAKGFCTDIEITSDNNKKRMPATSNAMEMWKVANSINNFYTQINNIVMTKITMKLGLNDAATEDNVLAAIKGIEDKAYASDVAKISAENSFTDLQNASKKDKEDFAKKLKDAEDAKEMVCKAYDKMKMEYDAMVTDKLTAETETKKVAAVSMVDGFAKAGRIKNDATAKLSWVEMAIADFDKTKNIIEALPLNKEAVITPATEFGKPGIINTAADLPTSAMGLAIKNKLKREGKI
jgi:ATP-dependent protease ClpP protease subunit